MTSIQKYLQEPNIQEALSFYQVLWKYTEDLRVVIEDLRYHYFIMSSIVKWNNLKELGKLICKKSNLYYRLQIKEIVDEEMNAANQHMAFGVTSLVLVLMISPIIIFLVRQSFTMQYKFKKHILQELSLNLVQRNIIFL